MTPRFSAQATLLAFAIATTLGGFMGGLWAGTAIALSLLLFANAWWADSRPLLLPRVKRGAYAGGAALLGLAGLLLLVPPLRVGLTLLKPQRLLLVAPRLLKYFAPRLVTAAARQPKRSQADILRGLPRPDRFYAWLALAALGVMALLALASVNPAVSLHKLLQMATIWLPLLALTCASVQHRSFHPRLFRWLPVYIAVTALALTAELWLGGPILQGLRGMPGELTQYNRGTSYLVIMALPAMAGLWLRDAGDGKLRLWIVPFLALLLLLAGETESRAAKMALLLALPVAGIALWRVQVAAWFLAVVPALLLGWPFMARALYHQHQDWLRQIPASWQARIEIWDYLSFRIAEHPILGWGPGTTHLLDWQSPDGDSFLMLHAAAPHAHNAVTQLWVELGLPGMALGLAFAYLTLYRAARLDRRIAPFALGCWVACVTLSLCAFDFWTDASWGCFALAGFAFALLDRRLLESAQDDAKN